MSDTLLESLAVASGGLFSVGPILIVLLFLSRAGGRLTSAAFLGGYLLGYAAVGSVALILSERLSSGEDGGPSTVTGVLLTVLGSVFLMLAVRTLRRKPEAPKNPRFFEALDAIAPRRAFAVGALITVINFKNLAIYLSAVDMLGEGSSSLRESLMGLPLVILVFCASPTVPLALSVIFRARVNAWLTRMRGWLERHTRTISIVLLTVFGSLFLWKGISAL